MGPRFEREASGDAVCAAPKGKANKINAGATRRNAMELGNSEIVRRRRSEGIRLRVATLYDTTKVRVCARFCASGGLYKHANSAKIRYSQVPSCSRREQAVRSHDTWHSEQRRVAGAKRGAFQALLPTTRIQIRRISARNPFVRLARSATARRHLGLTARLRDSSSVASIRECVGLALRRHLFSAFVDALRPARFPTP